MTYDPDRHHRRSIRLRDYDYAQAGAYFITICTYQRECLFGSVDAGVLTLNDWGRLAETEWLRTPTLRPQVELDEFEAMPNHLHIIVVIVETPAPGLDGRMPSGRMESGGRMQYAPTWRSPAQTVGAIVRGYKAAVTKQINDLRRTRDTPVWQRNYYEHVIRNEGELNRARQYILDNPARWEMDGYGQAREPHRA